MMLMSAAAAAGDVAQVGTVGEVLGLGVVVVRCVVGGVGAGGRGM